MDNDTNADDLTPDTEATDELPESDLMVDTNRWDDEDELTGDSDEPSSTDDLPPPASAGPVYDSTRQLVRDPYATLGGVASGIAHRLGWDTSLIRLAFVVLTFVSAGTFLLIYLLAWLIIPRASHWPPSPASGQRSGLSQRDLGLGLGAIGVFLAIAWGAGSFGAVLLPLLMIGAGVWLLVQNPRVVDAPAGTFADVGAAPPTGAVDGGATTPPPLAPPAPLGPPVPPRPGRRRGLKIVGLLLGALLLLGVIIPIVVVLSVTNGDLDFDNSGRIESVPVDVDSLPSSISADGSEIILDLRSLEPEMFDDIETPIPVAVSGDFASIDIIVPSDIDVSGDAELDFGSMRIFDEVFDGISAEHDFGSDDSMIDLDLDVNFGEIKVRRG